MSVTTDIDHLMNLAIKFRDDRNWKQFHDPKNLSMGLTIEAAELQELFLWMNPQEVNDFVTSDEGKAKIGAELADVMVFLLYLSHECNIDLVEAVRKKIQENSLKYPVEKSFNNHKKYTELE